MQVSRGFNCRGRTSGTGKTGGPLFAGNVLNVELGHTRVNWLWMTKMKCFRLVAGFLKLMQSSRRKETHSLSASKDSVNSPTKGRYEGCGKIRPPSKY